MSCSDCGLPNDRKSMCDRWDCPAKHYYLTDKELASLPPEVTVSYMPARTVKYMMPVISASDHRANDTTGVTGVVAGSGDGVPADPDLVPDLIWPFFTPADRIV